MVSFTRYVIDMYLHIDGLWEILKNFLLRRGYSHSTRICTNVFFSFIILGKRRLYLVWQNIFFRLFFLTWCWCVPEKKIFMFLSESTYISSRGTLFYNPHPYKQTHEMYGISMWNNFSFLYGFGFDYMYVCNSSLVNAFQQ